MRNAPFARRSRLLLASVLGVMLLLLPSCKKGRKPVFPVHGRITVDGKTGKDVFVYFHQLDDPDPGERTLPYGQTDESGAFKVSTYVQGDGAPAGEFVLTFEWPMPSGILKNNLDGPDRLKGRYKDQKKSSHRVTIKSEANELPPFQLTTTDKK